MSAETCIIATIVVYLLGMLLVGVFYARKNTSTSDFYLGGRHLGPLVTAMSAEASDMSSYLLMGLPGLAYLSGLADVGWTVVGLGVGTYLNWLFTAKRLRRYTQITHSITLPSFLSDRFKDRRHVLSCIAALIIIIFFVPYTASGFVSCGKLFSSLFGTDYMLAVVISQIVIVGYTVLGGFMAASFTDLIQSIIMTIAILAVLVFSTQAVGGLDKVIENASAIPGYLSLNSTYSEAANAAKPYGFLTIISTLAWGLGYFGMPHILLRFMAVENEDKLKISRRVASVWVVIAMAMAVLIGFIGKAMSNAGIIEVLSGTNTETVIVHISNLMSEHGTLLAIAAGLVMSGILACTMSTADSQLLAASSSVSENILQETLHLKLTAKQSMWVARGVVILISILGVILARNPKSSIFGIVSFAWAGFGAGFGPVIICSLFWKRTTFPGALAGMISGGAMVFIWKFLLKPMGGVFGIYELLPAFLVSILVIIVVSLLTPAPEQEIQDEFELARSNQKL